MVYTPGMCHIFIKELLFRVYVKGVTGDRVGGSLITGSTCGQEEPWLLLCTCRRVLGQDTELEVAPDGQTATLAALTIFPMSTIHPM